MQNIHLAHGTDIVCIQRCDGDGFAIADHKLYFESCADSVNMHDCTYITTFEMMRSLAESKS